MRPSRPTGIAQALPAWPRCDTTVCLLTYVGKRGALLTIRPGACEGMLTAAEPMDSTADGPHSPEYYNCNPTPNI
jgi:hypothetical protein